MNKRDHKILLRDKQNLDARLERKQFDDQPETMFRDSNIQYHVAERTRSIGYGGIGAIHKLVCRLGLDRGINKNVILLKYHVPYWESDHVLNIAYNVLSGGTCLEDIERLRNDETYMNGLEAERIPDPTTAGDFLRRFAPSRTLSVRIRFADGRRAWVRQEPDPGFHESVLSSSRGNNGILLIFAPSANDDRYRRMLVELDQEGRAVRDQNLLIVRVLEWGENWQGSDRLKIDCASALRQRFGIGTDHFSVLLIGADGFIKIRSNEVVAVGEIQRRLVSQA